MESTRLSAETKSALAMIALSLFMAPFVYILTLRRHSDPLAALGFYEPWAQSGSAWIAGLVLAAAYAGYCLRIPAVSAWLFRPLPLKLLALVLAVIAGILEEIAFRQMLMDWIAGLGGDPVAQVAVSGVAFGILHTVWGGLRGSWAATIGPIVATSVLGAGLAVVYLIGGRNLAPCIVSHFLVTALIEPGLLIAAFSTGQRAKGA